MSTASLRDPCVRSFLLPTRVVWQSESSNGVRDTAPLLSSHTGQSTLGVVPVCTLRRETGAESPGLLLDFGRELNGGIQIVAREATPAPVLVRVRFGESVSEAMGQPDNDHALHDLQIPIPALGTQEIGNTGFRFVRLDMITEGASLELIAVRAVSLVRPLERVGTFHCNDERLNAIWETSAHTIHLCMQELLWDGVKRDRLVWAGDMYSEAAAISAVYGAHDILPQSLDHLRDTFPIPKWMSGISSFSIWWLLTHRRWFRYYGNHAYLAEQREYLLALLDQLGNHVGNDGREDLGGFRFTDWPSQGDEEAIHAGLHALLIRGMDAGAELCAVLHEPEAGASCARLASQLRSHRPAYSAGRKVAGALLALANVHAPEAVNRQVLAREPSRGVSVFGGTFILEARALAGDHAGCLDLLRTYWGGMLDLGATTFWEDFDVDWLANAARIDELTPPGKVDVHTTYGDHCYKSLRHSLCHGWGAFPAAWLSENVLGVRPATPGFRDVIIEPYLGDLTEVTGTVPTPFGPISVSHRRVPSLDPDGGAPIETIIDLPEEITHCEARNCRIV